MKKYTDISGRIEIVLSVFKFSGVSGMIFPFSFSTTKIIVNLLPVKDNSSSWVSDESDKFFRNHFVKNISIYQAELE